MLLGVAGLVNGDCRSISAKTLNYAKTLGFKTLQIRIDDPQIISSSHIDRLKSLYKDHGFAMPQTVGNYGGGLISEDEKHRSTTIKSLKRTINITARLTSPNTYLRPGSLNSKGAWLPHPGNWSEEVFARLIDSTKQVTRVAENEGIKIAIEGGVVSPLHSPQRVKDLIDAVGSKALGFNMDPVNFIGNLQDAYNNAEFLKTFYKTIGNKIVCAHAKDFTVVESLLPHIKEEIIGTDNAMLDQVTFLKELQNANPKAHVLIEHLPDKDVPTALQGLLKASEKAGIKWD